MALNSLHKLRISALDMVNSGDLCDAFRSQARQHQHAAPALRSVDITWQPEQAGSALYYCAPALDADIRTHAVQFADVHVSVLDTVVNRRHLRPSTVVRSAINWDCMSVGNPGYGSVFQTR